MGRHNQIDQVLIARRLHSDISNWCLAWHWMLYNGCRSQGM